MKFIKNCFIGFSLGAGAILPGISSGVICVIFGIYEKLIDSILSFFKNPKNNFKFLFPLVLGGVIGIVCLGKILNFLLYGYPLQIKSIFIGLILGSVPSLLKETNKKAQFKTKYFIFFFISLLVRNFTCSIRKSYK